MIILIAPEEDIKNETEILNQLFKVGLEFYHLRKPLKNYQEHCVYLNKIEKQFHNRIVVHYFHELIHEFNLKGIHFQEEKRRNQVDVEIYNTCKKDGFTISSSFHELDELINCKIDFDYHLLSPVFKSISKNNYLGKGFDVNQVNKIVVGMGGANSSNLLKFTELGYKGVGILGGIWNSETPLLEFEKIKNYYE